MIRITDKIIVIAAFSVPYTAAAAAATNGTTTTVVII